MTEFVVSENIELCEGTNLACSFRPIDPPVAGERFTYWMSEVVHRLPHLHTPHPIKSEQEFHFGLSAPQPESGERWVRVLAFPLSADITKVHGTPPTAEVTSKTGGFTYMTLASPTGLTSTLFCTTICQRCRWRLT